jgi:MFS family permease
VDVVPVDKIIVEVIPELAVVQIARSIELSRSPVSLLTATPHASKDEIRTSLAASTIDGVFAALFSNVTSGVLLTSFLLELGASPAEVGMLAAIPMLANLVQPLGAYFSEQTTSRHYYCLWIYSISRSLWLGLAIAILVVGRTAAAPAGLIAITLGIALLSGLLGALGSAPWLSWMTVIVPRPLRGRYFGLRNSAANLTNLIAVPLMGWVVSRWRGGSLLGYGFLLILGVAFGLVSLWFQDAMVDVNPQAGFRSAPLALTANLVGDPLVIPPESWNSWWQDANFLKFLLYSSLWTFGVSLSAPFFTVYMLQDLALDISHVTIYQSCAAGANLLILIWWGKLSDRIGNQPILMGVGIVFAMWPLCWLVIHHDVLSIWLWLPLLHVIFGAAWAAIDLCSNNLLLEIVPQHNQSTYFGTAAAFAGISGTLGAVLGGCWGQVGYGGLLGLFLLSVLLRLGALLPLLLVSES